MERITLPAKLENLEAMLKFIQDGASGLGFEAKDVNQIQLVSEEVLVNVINYGYPDKEGDVEIVFSSTEDNRGIEIQVIDKGIPFDPLSMPEPNINAPLEERKIGGLGIFLLRRMMDKVNYRREDGCNILNFVKNKSGDNPNHPV